MGAARPALDKRSQDSIGLMSPVLCCHRYARLDTFDSGTLLLTSPVKSCALLLCVLAPICFFKKKLFLKNHIEKLNLKKTSLRFGSVFPDFFDLKKKKTKQFFNIK